MFKFCVEVQSMAKKENEQNVAPGKEFVFKLPSGIVVGKAKNLREFKEIVKVAPLDSVVYHAKGKHFGAWLKMLGQPQLASELGRLQINDDAIARTLVLRAVSK